MHSGRGYSSTPLSSLEMGTGRHFQRTENRIGGVILEKKTGLTVSDGYNRLTEKRLNRFFSIKRRP